MKTLLIINPYSRGGKSYKTAQKAMKYLGDKNYLFDHIFIENFDDAGRLSYRANREGVNRIIAVGGDGTINKVANGFFDGNGKLISNSVFGVIYTGTSPDFCKSYRIPTDVYAACDVLMKGNITEIPVGVVQFERNNANETKIFLCCANIGLGASLARKANSGIRKYLGDFAGTFISLLQLLINFRGTDYKVIREGGAHEFNNVLNLSLGITEYIASGIKINRGDSISGNELYMLRTANINAGNIIGLIRKIYSGKEFKNCDYLSLEYVKELEILNSAINNEVEFDGDPAGILPCRISLSPDKLPLLN